MINYKNVGKIYDNNVEAVKNINLRIPDGDFVFLVGESGSGKSTLIKLLMRELKPTTGDIIVNKKNLGKMRRFRVADYRRTLGIVFQDYKLLTDRSIYDNVACAMKVAEATTQEIRTRVPQVLRQVGLGHKFKSFPNELSGGEQQRAAIARAIVNKPTIILADEPTGNLDPRHAREIMKILLDINEAGATVVVATHDRTLVDEMHKRVVQLKDGQIVRDSVEGSYDGNEI